MPGIWRQSVTSVTERKAKISCTHGFMPSPALVSRQSKQNSTGVEFHLPELDSGDLTQTTSGQYYPRSSTSRMKTDRVGSHLIELARQIDKLDSLLQSDTPIDVDRPEDLKNASGARARTNATKVMDMKQHDIVGAGTWISDQVRTTESRRLSKDVGEWYRGE